MDVVGQSLGAGGFDGLQPVGEHGPEDLDHLPVAAGLAFELALNPAQGRWQVPVLEGGSVAQGAWFARQNRDVMKRIVDRLAATEGALMPPHDLTVLPAFQAVGIGADLDGPPDRTGVDRVAVLVEAHEAGLGHRRRDGVESIERTDIRHQARPLLFEHLPDRLVRNVGVPVRLGIGNAPVPEPGIQLGKGFELRPRHEEPSAEHAHLVLNLPLLPARRRCARHRIDQVMSAHLLETAIVGAILAHEDRVHRRLHVVVDAPRAGAAEEGERPVIDRCPPPAPPPRPTTNLVLSHW
jgi:hypothetical protein